MSRLPTPGADDGVWGDVLNDFLGVSHNADGTLKTTAVDGAASLIADANVAAGANIAQAKIANLVADLAAKTNLSTLTTKGDLYAATGAGVASRLGVGANRQVLKANSSTATGLNWSDDAVLNVKDFGAIGNGSTDDSAAVQSAVNAASSGGTVFFPVGTYLINTTISVPSGIRLLGTGYGSRLNRTVSGNIVGVVGVVGTNKTNVHISELRFTGPSTQATSVTGNGVYFDYADHCVVSGCWFSGFGLTNGNDGGLAGVRCSNITISHNDFTFNANGVCFGQPSGLVGLDHGLIVANVCTNNWEDGIHTQQCSYVNIADNICGNNGQVNVGAGIDLLRDQYDTVSGNICYNNGGNGIEVGSGASADIGHSFTGNICYQNLANGISLANLTTKCSVTGNNCFANTSHGISISPSGTAGSTMELMTVSGNQCHGNGANGINVSNPTATSIVQYCTISANSCSGNTSHGILLTARVENNIVIGNVCAGNTSNGIRLSAQAPNIPNNNVVTNNIVTGNATQIGQSGDTNTTLRSNKGVNPAGPAAITVGASPYTYTAGSAPEIVYINGGTVSDVSKSGTSVKAATDAVVHLEPNQTVTVTYSVAPTMVKDRL